jgi:hypothetical protein
MQLLGLQPQGFDAMTGETNEARILERAHEIAMTGKNVGRHSVEVKLRFEFSDPLALEILNRQYIKAELDRICADALVIKASKRAAVQAGAAAIDGTGERKRSGRRRLNAEQKRALKAAKLAKFVQQNARRAQKGMDPNDRHYSREIEQVAKRMKPESLDRLLRNDDDGD